MRWVIVALIAAWTLLTAFAYTVVLPRAAPDEEIVRAWFAVGADAPARPHLHESARRLLDAFEREAGPDFPGYAAALDAPDPQRLAAFNAFRAWYAKQDGLVPLRDTPRLVWSTDDNPARRVQCRLFREWRIREYGAAVDILTDPSNRDITKTIVQCVAGAGPDIIEAYGPAELNQFVSAGVALDVTDIAQRDGFDDARIFDAAVSSVSVNGRQYAFPCNVGYVVLFYHRDLFEQAGVTEPGENTRGWTIEQLVDTARQVMAADLTGRRIGVMGMGAWGMVLSGGATFFNESRTASFFNGPEAIAALRAYQDLMYVHRVMPTPAEAASMASSGGANMNLGAEAASAASLFAAKVTAMVIDGRWSYVSLATRNRDRVLIPAMQRRLAELDAGAAERAPAEAELLRAAIASLTRDVLVPISDAQYGAMETCLTDADRARLLRVGVAHVPTPLGVPWYEAAARVAIVNRASPNAAYATEFLRFLASEPYNEQINQTFDSICGVPAYCEDEDGIAGPPRALPGLEAFDSPVFVEAMAQYAHPWELSPYVGRGRLGILVGPILEQVTNNAIGPAEAARLIEDRINAQIHANLVRDAQLRADWERATGKAFNPRLPLRAQLESADATKGAAP